MRNGVFWLSLVLASAIGLLGALGINARPASALTSDVCIVQAWDSTGNVLADTGTGIDGGIVGGDGHVYVLFRVEDDAFGYVNDFLDGPVQDVIDEILDKIASGTLGPEEEAAMQEVVDELQAALEGFHVTDLVLIDPNGGAASISSKMEITGFEWVKPRASHLLTNRNPLLNQRVDHVFPEYFTDPDGHDLDSIRAWLAKVAGVPVPSAVSDKTSLCGDSGRQDGWGFVDLTCIEAGGFNVNVIPNVDHPISEVTSGTIHLVCPGVPNSATISASPTSLEIQPVGNSASTSTITVAVSDQFGDRIDGAVVTWYTDNCTFVKAASGAALSPGGGGKVVQNVSNTSGAADSGFLADNPSQHSAGTAEVVLDCANTLYSPHAGPANVKAVVERPGADIVLDQVIKVVGPPATITLSVDPTLLTCGGSVKATAKVIDAAGQDVSDGSLVLFTTDTTSGITGGYEGGQGQGLTVAGLTSATLASDPSKPGTHTVVATTSGSDKNGKLIPQVKTVQTYNCTVAVAAAATVTAPATGTGSVIKPPSTGDAGLASGQSAGRMAWFGGLIALVTFGSLGGWRLRTNGRRR